MFTGLIEEIGEITRVDQLEDAVRLTVTGPKVVSDAKHGDSIQVAGVCLTVADQDEKSFTADVMKQTLDVTTLGSLKAGSPVNLERAVKADTRLGGHIVQGHIDGVAKVLKIINTENWRIIRFEVAKGLARMLVDKGSVTVDGVSLTVANIAAAKEEKQWFEVSLIPETLAATTLGTLEEGQRVNIETDIIARHVARMLEFSKES